MKGLQEYNLPLKSLQIGVYEYEYRVDDAFFESVEAPDITRGSLNVALKVDKKSTNIELNFVIDGTINTKCDRCLSDLELEVDANETIYVKFGKEYSEESDELIVIPEDDGMFNVAWLVYEFIVLNLPMCRQHEEGECSEEMQELISQYIVEEIDEADDESEAADAVENENKEVDPRWAALKNILDNN